MYQSGNKHGDYENQVTNGGDIGIFQWKKLQKSRRLVNFWQNIIILFSMIFYGIFSGNEAHKNYQIQF